MRFLPIVTDPNYFTAPEVARLLHVWWWGGANAPFEAVVAQASVPDVIRQKQTVAGFVFTHREGGLKLLQVGFETDREMLRFRFVLPVGDTSYAIQNVDFGNIYPPDTVEAVDLATLRQKLVELSVAPPTRQAMTTVILSTLWSSGAALTRFLHLSSAVGGSYEPFDLHSIYRTIRAFFFHSEYLNAPVSPLYVFGRQQDVALQKARDTVSLRNHLRRLAGPVHS